MKSSELLTETAPGPDSVSKPRFTALGDLQASPLRHHLAASALVAALFILVFAKALFGGYNYGALPLQQVIGITWQNPSIHQPGKSDERRQPNLIDPDLHFLYELDYQAAARDLRAGHLPFFDFSRMLGVPLWGSIIYDFGNPLNLLLKFLSVQHVHLVKVLVCMLLAANGFVALMREMSAKTAVAWVVPTLLYLSTNYAIYFIHWAGAFGVICAAPLLLAMILRFLRTGGVGAFLGVFLCACCVAVAHCTHIAAHLMVLCAVSCGATVLLARKEWTKLLPRLALLGFAGLCAAIACFEILWQLQITSAESGRLPALFEHHTYPYRPLPPLGEMYSEFFFGNLDPGGIYWDTFFLPLAAVVSIFGVFGRGQPRSREIRIVSWLALFFLIFFYVGWLDAPLILLLGKLYAPNPLASRGLLNLYLPLVVLAGLGAERLLSEPARGRLRVFAWIGLGVAAFLGVLAIFIDDSRVRFKLFSYPYAAYVDYVGSFPFWVVWGGNALWLGALLVRKIPNLRGILIFAGAAAVCLGMTAGRVGFYKPKDVARIPLGNPADINTPRVVRLLPGTEYLVSANNLPDMRFVHDAPLPTMGLKTLTGYHTSMSKRELNAFDSLVSDQHLHARETGYLRMYSLGFFHVFLDGRAVVEGNALRPEKVLILKLLGVDFVIDGVALSHLDRKSAFDFSRWPGVNLHVSNCCHLVEGTADKDVVALFNGSLDRQRVAEMTDRLRPIVFEPIPKGEGYRARVTGTAGTVVVPYHFGRWFKVTLDGEVVDEPEGLGLCIVGVTPQSKVLEIRPRREGIIKRSLAGLIAGSLLAVFGSYLCLWLAKTGPRPEASAGVRPIGPQRGAAKPRKRGA
jgi:hypothetical protein